MIGRTLTVTYRYLDEIGCLFTPRCLIKPEIVFLINGFIKQKQSPYTFK